MSHCAASVPRAPSRNQCPDPPLPAPPAGNLPPTMVERDLVSTSAGSDCLFGRRKRAQTRAACVCALLGTVAGASDAGFFQPQEAEFNRFGTLRSVWVAVRPAAALRLPVAMRVLAQPADSCVASCAAEEAAGLWWGPFFPPHTRCHHQIDEALSAAKRLAQRTPSLHSRPCLRRPLLGQPSRPPACRQAHPPPLLASPRRTADGTRARLLAAPAPAPAPPAHGVRSPQPSRALQGHSYVARRPPLGKI